MTLASWMVQQFRGRGKRIVRVDPIQGPVLVVIDIRSSGHSAVWSLDGNGGKCELHVNRVGNYSGTIILNEDVPVPSPIVRSDSRRLRTICSGV